MALDRDGPCLPAGLSECSQRFEYEWDEVGRLVRAKRWDVANPGVAGDGVLPPGNPAANLSYEYDAGDQRVIKTATDGALNESHTLYVFESLELRRTQLIIDEGTGEPEYELTKWTEVPYLFANGVRIARLVFDDRNVPAIDGNSLHVFFELGDHLGSTSVVLDKATSELVERATFQAYGAPESDYRPDRWEGFREDYRFTGKEEDVEVGLQYFVKRFLSPRLNRWVSADPLAVHAGGGGLNGYAYVNGQSLKAIDPLGLQPELGGGGNTSTGGGGAKGQSGTGDPPPVGEDLDATGLAVVTACGFAGGPVGLAICAGLSVAADSPSDELANAPLPPTLEGLAGAGIGRLVESAARGAWVAYKAARQAPKAAPGSRLPARVAPAAGHAARTTSAPTVGRLPDVGQARLPDIGKAKLPDAPTPKPPPKASFPEVDVWKLKPTTRGTVIEERLARTEYKDWWNIGQERGGTFPLVDFQMGNTLVSLKTVNTTGKTWKSRMRAHIADLSTRGATVSGRPARMVLDVRVQPGGSAAAQGLISYGAKKGVTVRVADYP